MISWAQVQSVSICDSWLIGCGFESRLVVYKILDGNGLKAMPGLIPAPNSGSFMKNKKNIGTSIGQTDKKNHRLEISRVGLLSNSKILIQNDLNICDVAYIWLKIVHFCGIYPLIYSHTLFLWMRDLYFGLYLLLTLYVITNIFVD